MLREFCWRKVQPLLMRLASNEKARNAFAKLMPLVTVKECPKCLALEYCLNACEGFRNIYLKVCGRQ